MASPHEIRDRIASLLLALDGIESSFPYEEETLGPMPCATLLLRTVDPAATATGPRLDVDWTWEMRLYFGLSDWSASQQQMDIVIPQVLNLWRDDPTLDHLTDGWRILDGGEPVEFNTVEGWMRKTLLALAQVETIGP